MIILIPASRVRHFSKFQCVDVIFFLLLLLLLSSTLVVLFGRKR